MSDSVNTDVSIDIDNQAINKEYLYEQFKLFNSNVLRSIYGMKSDNIDSIDTSNIGVGQVIQYTGETNANYINSFFYRWDGSKWTLINMGSSSMTFKAPLYSDGSAASLNLDYNDPNALTGELIPIDSTREVSLTEAIDENRSDILELMGTRLYTYTDLSQLESEVTLVADVDNISDIIAAMKPMSQLILTNVNNRITDSYSGYYDIKYYVYGTVINKLHIIKLDEGDAAITAHMNTGAVLNRSMVSSTLSDWASVGHVLKDGYENDGTIAITGRVSDYFEGDIYGDGTLPSTLGLGEDVMTWPNGNYRVSHVNGDGLESVTNLPNGVTTEFRISHFNLKRWGSDHNPHTATYGVRSSIMYSRDGNVYHRYQESGSTAGTLIKDTGWIKFGAYTTLAELGLDGTATIDQVIATVPIGSSAFIDVIDFSDPAASGLPITEDVDRYSVLYIDKQAGSRTKILFLRKDASRVLYGGMNANGIVQWWIEYATLNTDQTFTGAKTFNKPTTFNDITTMAKDKWHENSGNGIINNAAIQMHNSDISGLNAIYFNDESSSAGEGIHFTAGTNRFNTIFSNNRYLLYESYRNAGTVKSLPNSSYIGTRKISEAYSSGSFDSTKPYYKLATFSINTDRESTGTKQTNAYSELKIRYGSASIKNDTIMNFILTYRGENGSLGNVTLKLINAYQLDNSPEITYGKIADFIFAEYSFTSSTTSGQGSLIINIWGKGTANWNKYKVIIGDTFVGGGSTNLDQGNERWTLYNVSGVGQASHETSGYTQITIDKASTLYAPTVAGTNIYGIHMPLRISGGNGIPAVGAPRQSIVTSDSTYFRIKVDISFKCYIPFTLIIQAGASVSTIIEGSITYSGTTISAVLNVTQGRIPATYSITDNYINISMGVTMYGTHTLTYNSPYADDKIELYATSSLTGAI